MSYVDPPRKVLQHIDRIALVQAGKRPPPVNVEIDLSNRCSLGCEWCHFAYTHTRGPLATKNGGPNVGGDLMDTGLAMRLLDELHDYDVRGIIWSGGGEPTLHPYFNRIIAHCRIPQGLYTHGAHIDKERGALLKDKMKWVVVSLDAIDAESYRQAKRVAYFDRAKAGISNLASAYGGAVIGVSFLLNRDNWQQVDQMRALAIHELGADYVTFRPAVLFDESEQDKPAEYAQWANYAADELEYYAGDERVIVEPDRFRDYAGWLPGDRPYSACYWSAIATVITPNGAVWTCCNKREHDGAGLGNVAEEPFRDIWERAQTWTDLSNCRVMCRGHIPNTALAGVFEPQAHGAFI